MENRKTTPTVRYAKKRNRKIYIVMPDGVVEGINEDAAMDVGE